MTGPYDHRVPWEDTGTGRRLCGACGLPTTGAGTTLRHDGEGVRPIVPDRADMPAFAAAVAAATHALERLNGVPDRTDTDRVRVIVEELYVRGALRTGRSAWRRRTVRAA